VEDAVNVFDMSQQWGAVVNERVFKDAHEPACSDRHSPTD
jgi:hypothetical protein